MDSVSKPAHSKQKVETMDNSEWEFEEIDETEIESVARGRKSSVPQALIDGLAGLKKGKAVKIPSQKLDPKSVTYKTDKARVSAVLRTAMRAAGHDAFSIIFAPDGTPQIRLK